MFLFFLLPPLLHPTFLVSTGALTHDTAPPQPAPHIGRHSPAAETSCSPQTCFYSTTLKVKAARSSETPVQLQNGTESYPMYSWLRAPSRRSILEEHFLWDVSVVWSICPVPILLTLSSACGQVECDVLLQRHHAMKPGDRMTKVCLHVKTVLRREMSDTYSTVLLVTRIFKLTRDKWMCKGGSNNGELHGREFAICRCYS